jgi:hypothetical protein
MKYEDIHSSFTSLVNDLWDNEYSDDPCDISMEAGTLLRKEYSEEECDEYFNNYDFNIYDYLDVEFE